MIETPQKSKTIRILDLVFLLGALLILIIFTTVYLMPFRLDDVLHMDWAREFSFFDAFDVARGEIVRSVRPVFAMTIWLLTHTAGIQHYFPWHAVLVGSFLIGLAYAGKTARYIAKDDTALYYTTGFFWLAFLPILNVLFWYGDLTYTIELMFVAPAWYYGFRGLLEGRIGLWLIGIISGILAVLAKEPALLLVHSIFAGTFILFYSEIKTTWKKNSAGTNIISVLLYCTFLAISLKLYFASPTRSNRFFHLDTLPREQLLFYIHDRLRYYSEALLNPIARILLVTPLLYFIFRQINQKNKSLLASLSIFLVSCLTAFFGVKSVIVFAVILLLAPVLGMLREKDIKSHKASLLFSVSAVIILAVLLITVMLVKTQLAELSFVLLVIAGIYWPRVVKEITAAAKPYLMQRKIATSVIAATAAIIIVGVYFATPTIKAKELLLRNVRDVRSNANDALKWMGTNLSPGSEVLVGGTRLYGLGGADEMTSKDDEYKLYAQYTFLQGYVRSYFHALNRTDIALGYLDDSVKLSQVLDSCRSLGNYYLFLQTGYDVDRFHSLIDSKKQLLAHDTLLAKFDKGPFPSEVWKLRN